MADHDRGGPGDELDVEAEELVEDVGERPETPDIQDYLVRKNSRLPPLIRPSF
jgi:hypothetical protein